MNLDALARTSGTFLMVAMDQRESLRTMFRDHGDDDGGARAALQDRGCARARSVRVGLPHRP
jgi:tagatose-1,6-bisphosphate aldolase